MIHFLMAKRYKMRKKKCSLMRYKRDKTGVEISGDADQVKGFV